MADAEYSSISLKLEGDNSSALSSVQELKNALSELATLSNAIKGLKPASMKKKIDGIVSAVNSINEIEVDMSKVNDAVTALTSLTDVSERIKGIGNIARYTKSLKNAMNDLSSLNKPQEVNLDDKFPKTTPNYATQNFLSPFEPQDIDDRVHLMDMLSSAVEELKNKLVPLGNIAENAWQQMLSFGQSIGNKFLQKINTASKAIKSFTFSLGRIALYRAIRTVIKSIASGISESLGNVYQWALITGNQFASSMDMIAASAQYMSNSFGAMSAPLYNQLAPVIDAIVDKFVSLFNVINQVMSALGGSGKWIKAIKQPKAYADAVAGTGSAAKKAKKEVDLYLASFDELHIIPTPKDSETSGGGGTGNTVDYSGMFEEEEIDSSVKSFTEQLKDLFNAGDWLGIGQLLGDKVNGLVDSINFNDFGKKIGAGIDAGLKITYSTLESIDFEKIGNKMSEFLNGAFEKIDFSYLGRLLVRKVTSAVDFLIGAINTFNFGGLGQAISDFISGSIREASNWIFTTDWQELGKSISSGAVDLFKNIDLLDIIEAGGEFIQNVFTGLVDFAAGFLEGFWSSIFECFDFKKAVEESVIGKFIGAFVPGWNKESKKITDGTNQTWETVEDNSKSIWQRTGDWLTGMWSELSNTSDESFSSMEDNIEKSMGNTEKKTTSIWDSICKSVNSDLDEMEDGVTDHYASMSATIGGTWNGVLGDTTLSWDEISRNLMEYFIKIKDNATNFFGKIKDGTKEAWNKIKENMVSPIKAASDNIKGFIDKIKGYFDFKISFPHIPLPHFNIQPSGWKAADLLKGSIPSLSVSYYAKGGLPDAGELFVAREAGAEMVGTIGGHTAVANNDQIVSAIAIGVESAVRKAMSVNGGGSIDLTVNLDGEVVYRNVVDRNNEKVAQTGMSELLV